VDAVAGADAPVLMTFLEPLVNLALGLEQRDALAALLAPTLTAKNGVFTTGQVASYSQFLDTLSRRKVSLTALSTGTDLLARQLAGADSLLVSARQMSADVSEPISARASAAGLLARVPSGRPETLALLAGWIVPRQPAELQRAGIRALTMTVDASVPARLLNGWPSFSPETRVAALDALLSREPWTFEALVHSQTNGMPAFDAARRGQLLKHNSARVRELAAKVFNTASATSRAKVIEQFQPALNLPGNAVRGEVLYTKLCSACHKRGEAGNEVGPDLLSVAEHPSAKLLVNILDPNADVQPGFHAYTCRLADGTELYGLIAAETGNSITFKLADGTKRSVLRASIAELNGGNMSLMPEGLEAGLTAADIADLLQFLRSGPRH
jgi:putative heme-binding domain-containing protein